MRTVRARRGITLGFAVIIVILGGASAAWACTPEATINSISPSSGAPGTTLTVTATEFHPDLLVEVHWQGSRGPVIGSAVAGPDGSVLIRATIPRDARPSVVKPEAIFAMQYKDGKPFDAPTTFSVTEPVGQTTNGQTGGDSSTPRAPEQRVDPLRNVASAPEPVTSPGRTPSPAIGGPALSSTSPAPQSVAPAASTQLGLSPDPAAPSQDQLATPSFASPALLDNAAPEVAGPAAPRDLTTVGGTPPPATDARPSPSFGSPAVSGGLPAGVFGVGFLAIGLVALFAGFTVAEVRRRRVLASLPLER